MTMTGVRSWTGFLPDFAEKIVSVNDVSTALEAVGDFEIEQHVVENMVLQDFLCLGLRLRLSAIVAHRKQPLLQQREDLLIVIYNEGSDHGFEES